jgi:RasGEF domain/RhoGEF domain/RasGEF N-terminal motif
LIFEDLLHREKGNPLSLSAGVQTSPASTTKTTAETNATKKDENVKICEDQEEEDEQNAWTWLSPRDVLMETMPSYKRRERRINRTSRQIGGLRRPSLNQRFSRDKKPVRLLSRQNSRKSTSFLFQDRVRGSWSGNTVHARSLSSSDAAAASNDDDDNNNNDGENIMMNSDDGDASADVACSSSAEDIGGAGGQHACCFVKSSALTRERSYSGERRLSEAQRPITIGSLRRSFSSANDVERSRAGSDDSGGSPPARRLKSPAEHASRSPSPSAPPRLNKAQKAAAAVDRKRLDEIRGQLRRFRADKAAGVDSASHASPSPALLSNVTEMRAMRDTTEESRVEKRARLVAELERDEMIYVSSLAALSKGYDARLRELLPDSTARALFGPLRHFLAVHEALYGELSERALTWDEPSCIADVMSKWTLNLEYFENYAASLIEIDALLAHVENRPTEFAVRLSTCSVTLPNNSSVQFHGLDGLRRALPLPIERLPAYASFLERLRDVTPAHHRDARDVERALTAIQHAVKFIDKRRKRSLSLSSSASSASSSASSSAAVDRLSSEPRSARCRDIDDRRNVWVGVDDDDAEVVMADTERPYVVQHATLNYLVRLLLRIPGEDRVKDIEDYVRLIEMFFCTYRTFVEAQHLWQKFVEAFDGAPDARTSSAAAASGGVVAPAATALANSDSASGYTRRAVCRLIHFWFKTHPDDFSDALLEQLRHFAAFKVVETPHCAGIGRFLLKAVDRRKRGIDVDPPPASPSTTPRDDRIGSQEGKLKEKRADESDEVCGDGDAQGKGNESHESNDGGANSDDDGDNELMVDDFWMRFSVREIAEQLTWGDYAVYDRIRVTEFAGLAWQDESEQRRERRAPSIVQLIERVNKIARIVAHSIVDDPTKRERTRRLKMWCQVMRELLALQNFTSLIAISSALDDPAVHRLKATFAALSPKYRALIETIKRIFDPTKSYKAFRTRYANCRSPCVPFIGVYLRDIVFIEDGNPDDVRGLINVHKRSLAHDVLSDLLQHQEHPYAVKENQRFQHYLANYTIDYDDDQMWDLSREHECHFTK